MPVNPPQLAAQRLKVSGGPVAYQNAGVLALALNRIDLSCPGRWLRVTGGMGDPTLRNIHQITKDMAHG